MLKVIAFFLLLSSQAIALELQEETPTQRCAVETCYSDCTAIYGPATAETSKDENHRDYGPVGIAMCKQSCDIQRTSCLSHPGTSVQVPDWAPSSMGKMMTLYCFKQPKDQRRASGCEKQIYCSNVSTYNTPACQ
jgi:hypothetical protein